MTSPTLPYGNTNQPSHTPLTHTPPSHKPKHISTHTLLPSKHITRKLSPTHSTTRKHPHYTLLHPTQQHVNTHITPSYTPLNLFHPTHPPTPRRHEARLRVMITGPGISPYQLILILFIAIGNWLPRPKLIYNFFTKPREKTNVFVRHRRNIASLQSVRTVGHRSNIIYAVYSDSSESSLDISKLGYDIFKTLFSNIDKFSPNIT